MINFILATAMCQGCAILDKMDKSPDSEAIICTHQCLPCVNMKWKDIDSDGPPEDGENYIIFWKGYYIEAMWSDILPMWYTPFFTEKKFIEAQEVKYYAEVPSN